MNNKILLLFVLIQTYAALPSVTLMGQTENQRRSKHDHGLQKIDVNGKFITSLINGFIGNGSGRTGNADVDSILDSVKAVFRSDDKDSQQDIKPVFVKFRSNQPSLMFEVNSNAILGAFKKFVNSDSLDKVTQVVARKAADALKTIVQNNKEEDSQET